MSALPDSAATAPLEVQSQPRPALTAVPDRATREAAAAAARLAYCEQLKEVRERRGITLAEIAERSKVSEGLYAALERADVSRWPMGIYRRSFFRAYALALGLPVEPALSEFVLLFPDEDEQQSSTQATSSAPLRMTLAGRTWMRTSRMQVAAALVDLIMVVAITAAVAWWLPVALGTVAAAVTVVYYSVATACFACSPGIWWLRTRGYRKRAKALRLARG